MVAADVECVVLLLSNTVFSSPSALLLAVSKESSSVSISSPCKPFVFRNSTLRFRDAPRIDSSSRKHRACSCKLSSAVLASSSLDEGCLSALVSSEGWAARCHTGMDFSLLAVSSPAIAYLEGSFLRLVE